jgi:hypothetical protein
MDMESEKEARDISINVLENIEEEYNMNFNSDDYIIVSNIGKEIFSEHEIKKEKKLRALVRAKVKKDISKSGSLSPLNNIEDLEESNWSFF